MDTLPASRRFVEKLASFFRRSRRSRVSESRLALQRRRSFVKLHSELLEDRRLLAADVWTDKLDYHPGETAIISGSGFAVGETIHLEVTRADGTQQGTPDNPWELTDGVFVDGGSSDLDGEADGNFRTTWYVNPVFATNQTLVVTATGLTSGLTDSATFTDSAVGTYDQCSNDDGDGYASGDTGCRWINGNLQKNNSTYAEGDATVQRLWLTDLVGGS